MRPSMLTAGKHLSKPCNPNGTLPYMAVRRLHSSPRSLAEEYTSRRSRQNTSRDGGYQNRGPRRDSRNRPSRPNRSSRPGPSRGQSSKPEITKPASDEAVPGIMGRTVEVRKAKPAKVQITAPRASLPLTPEALITNHVATASASPYAHRATILNAQAHLARRESTAFGFDSLLAKALRFGKVVRFANNDEKLRAVALAQEHSDTAARRLSLKTKTGVQGKRIEFVAAPKKYRDELVGRVSKGNYQENKAVGTGAVAEIGKRLWLNESYLKKSGIGFLSIIKRLMPQTTATKA